MSFLASVLVMPSTQHAPSNLKRPSVNFAPSIWHDTFLKYVDSKFLVERVDGEAWRQGRRFGDEAAMQRQLRLGEVANLLHGLRTRTCSGQRWKRKRSQILRRKGGVNEVRHSSSNGATGRTNDGKFFFCDGQMMGITCISRGARGGGDDMTEVGGGVETCWGGSKV
ncbi:hypothetical protein S245_062852 [Arachis hypogaea]